MASLIQAKHPMRIAESTITAEEDIIERVSGLPVDIAAMAVVSNIWRAGQLFRKNADQEVLGEYNLTWASFSTLFIVWVWGPIDMGGIAESQSVKRSTVTSTVSLLEKRGYCTRSHPEGNRRSVVVELTPEGQALIEQVFPQFNQYEKQFTSSLTPEEIQTLSALLRKVIIGSTPQE